MTEPTVTQADRDAAENALFELRGFRTRIASDKHCVVQAFARHRTASAPAGEVIAVLYSHPEHCDEVELGAVVHGHDLAAGWTETPLYAHPPAPAELVEAAKLMMMLERSIKIDVGSCHSNRGPGASSEMREDDRDMRRDIEAAFDRLRTALKHGGA